MARGFQAVEEHEIPTIAEQPPPKTQSSVAQSSSAATQMLLLAIGSLSKRFVIALSAWFTAAGLFSAWWLWSTVLPNPSVLQLVGVGMYAAFLLALEFVRRKG